MSDPTVVWLVTSTFEPRGSSIYTLRLARSLPEFGVQPVIVCESADWVPRPLREQLTIHEVPHLTSSLFRGWRLGRLLGELGANPPDLIHAQRRNLDELTLQLADRLDRPYLITVQETLPMGQSLMVLPHYLGGIIAVSPSVARDLVVSAHTPQTLVHVIPNGVDVAWEGKGNLDRVEDQVPVVGAIGALETVKGFTYFLMAAELILSSGYDVEFLIAGAGPEESVLRRAAQHLDIANRVTFVGYMGDVRDALEAIDVFVLPSLEQGLGTVMFEAMAMRKPVVATKVGGVADFVVDGEHALLAPPANHVLLADKIKYLLDNPEKAKRIATAGQRLVQERFTARKMAEQTAALYREILAKQPALASAAG